MLQAIFILTVVYLPGHYLGRWMMYKGDGLTELVLLRVAASVAVAGPLLTLLALAGWFTGPAIVATLGLLSAVAFLLGRGKGGEVRVTRWDLTALALVAGSLVLYSRPAEHLLNQR